MRKIPTLVFIALTLLGIRSYGGPSACQKPDARLTPGKANPNLTRDVICSPKFRTGDYRRVSDATRKRVYTEYGIVWSSATSKLYEVDHLIPLELGGSNDVTNLWPQPYSPRPGAHEKDLAENYLHRQVCGDAQIPLSEAQRQIINWTDIPWLAPVKLESKP